jgi:hypothetical protein
MRNKNQAHFFILSCLYALLLLFTAGCVPIYASHVELTLYRDEKWEMNTTLEAAPELQGMLQLINPALDEIRQQGVTVDFELQPVNNEGRLPLTLDFAGQGYALLSDEILSGGAIQVDEGDGERRIMFNAWPSQTLLSGALESSFTLRGGKIISSNGTPAGSGAVRWDNPTSQMQAVLTERSSSGSVVGWILLILLAAGGAGAYFYWRSRPKTAYAPAPGTYAASPADSGWSQPEFTPPTSAPGQFTPPSGPAALTQFCHQCGKALPPGASFCPACGTQTL